MLNKYYIMIPTGLYGFVNISAIVCYITSYGNIWGFIIEKNFYDSILSWHIQKCFTTSVTSFLVLFNIKVIPSALYT